METPVPSLSISESLSRSWRAVSKNIWLMAGFTLCYYVVIALLGRIGSGMSIVNNLFSFVFAAGLFSAFHKIETGAELNFNDFFSWSPRFGKLFGTYLVLFLIMLLIAGGAVIAIILSTGMAFFTDVMSGVVPDISSASAAMLLVTLLFSFIIMFVFFLFSFGAMYLAQFQDLSLSQRLSLSWKIGRSNAGQLFLFLLLALLVVILGTLALLIGLLVAIPVIVGMQYYFLRSMFPEEERQPEWDFMKNNQQ